MTLSHRRKKTGGFWGLKIGLVCLFLFPYPGGKVFAQNEIVTVPVVLADYYGWAYTEAFEDHADVYAWSTAGVDALGWTLFFAAKDYDAGLFLVNLAGFAKTLYPVVTLLGASDSPTRERAWIAVGTHSATLLTLELLGRPALSIQTSLGPRQEGVGVAYAMGF
jgi:hypothetical protein